MNRLLFAQLKAFTRSARSNTFPINPKCCRDASRNFSGKSKHRQMQSFDSQKRSRSQLKTRAPFLAGGSRSSAAWSVSRWADSRINWGEGVERSLIGVWSMCRFAKHFAGDIRARGCHNCAKHDWVARLSPPADVCSFDLPIIGMYRLWTNIARASVSLPMLGRGCLRFGESTYSDFAEMKAEADARPRLGKWN